MSSLLCPCGCSLEAPHDQALLSYLVHDQATSWAMDRVVL
jgi:hypothetical protein